MPWDVVSQGVLTMLLSLCGGDDCVNIFNEWENAHNRHKHLLFPVKDTQEQIHLREKHR